MRTSKFAGAIAVGVVVLGACTIDMISGLPSDVVLDPGDEVESETLYASTVSGLYERKRAVLTDQETFSAVWDQVHDNHVPTPEAPEVDFEDSMVIVASMGGRPSGGYVIRIEGIARVGDDLRVELSETSPGKTCGTISMITAPVVMVQVPKVEGDVVFREESRVQECD